MTLDFGLLWNFIHFVKTKRQQNNNFYLKYFSLSWSFYKVDIESIRDPVVVLIAQRIAQFEDEKDNPLGLPERARPPYPRRESHRGRRTAVVPEERAGARPVTSMENVSNGGAARESVRD